MAARKTHLCHHLLPNFEGKETFLESFFNEVDDCSGVGHEALEAKGHGGQLEGHPVTAHQQRLGPWGHVEVSSKLARVVFLPLEKQLHWTVKVKRSLN